MLCSQSVFLGFVLGDWLQQSTFDESLQVFPSVH